MSRFSNYICWFKKNQLSQTSKQKKIFSHLLIDKCFFPLQIESEHNNKENAPRNFNFIIRKENDEKNFDDIIEQIKMSYQGKTLGVFSKDKMEGPFCEQWENRLNQHLFTTVKILFKSF